MLKLDSEIGQVVLGLTPPYLEPGCHEALHEVDLGVLKLESGARTFGGANTSEATRVTPNSARTSSSSNVGRMIPPCVWD
jgi:hypothetical protein